MADAKAGLLAHLKKEDEQLYPKLHSAAKSDPALQRTLDIFASEMDVISKDALAFFKKYGSGGSGLDFSRDFGRLFAKLGQRIRAEETMLYKKFDELDG